MRAAALLRRLVLVAEPVRGGVLRCVDLLAEAATGALVDLVAGLLDGPVGLLVVAVEEVLDLVLQPAGHVLGPVEHALVLVRVHGIAHGVVSLRWWDPPERGTCCPPRTRHGGWRKRAQSARSQLAQPACT